MNEKERITATVTNKAKDGDEINLATRFTPIHKRILDINTALSFCVACLHRSQASRGGTLRLGIIHKCVDFSAISVVEPAALASSLLRKEGATDHT